MDAEAQKFEEIAKWSQIVCAIVFLLFLIWAIRKYIGPAIDAATKARNAELAAAEKHRDAVQAAVAVARGEVEAADRDALSIVSRAKSDAVREREDILAAAKADGERVVRNAEGELERARMAARASLREEFVRKALASARTAAAARVDATMNSQLVGTTIDSVERERAGALN